MAGLFKKKLNKEQRELRQRFGFTEVKAALNPAGEEMFGMIELAPEYGIELFPVSGRKAKPGKTRYFSAALRLTGPELNLALADDKQEQNFWAALGHALPVDSPTQILLRRRRGELATHYQSWQETVQQRLADSEVAYFFLQDYLDNLIYPVEESGLTETWTGIFVSGRSQEEVAARLAFVMSNLPCEASPCTSAELSLLLLDYFAPQLLQEMSAEDGEIEQLYASWLAETDPQMSEEAIYNNDLTSHFWTLAAPPPNFEGGWTRPLLESEALAESEFDLIIHLAPAPVDQNLYDVLNRRIEALERMIGQARVEGNKSAVRELAEQRQEIENRFSALSDGNEHYFEAGISLMLRTSPEENGKDFEEVAAFEQELTRFGLAPRPVRGFEKLEDALLNCAPLNLGHLPRSFVLPAQTTGRLAQIVCEGRANTNPALPLAGLTPTGHPVFLDPAARAGESALFFLGNPGKTTALPARALTQYLMAMRFLEGSPVCGFDPTGDWSASVKQLGGTYLAFGPEQQGKYGWNPLCIAPEKLNDLKALEGWVEETADYLDRLLELNPLEQQDLSPLLLECAIEAVGQGKTIDAEALYRRAQAGGYRLLAEKLDDITSGGFFGWLFAEPTNLPSSEISNGLLFMGFSPEALEELNPEVRRFYLGRVFAAWVEQLASRPRQPLLLIMDEAQEFLVSPQANRALQWLGRNAAQLGISLWTLSPRSDEWLTSTTGQKMLDAATWQFFFNQNGAGLSGIARRMALPQRALKIIRELVPGSALMRHSSGALTELMPLPGDYVTRLIPSKTRKQIAASAPAAVAAPATNATPTPATASAEPKTAVSRAIVPEPSPVAATEAEANRASPNGTEADKDPIFIFANARGA